jgi:hypothetical protein
MADYQVRGWTGWHHHMVMVLLAMLFILELQIEWGEKAHRISVMDVKEILEAQLWELYINPIIAYLRHIFITSLFIFPQS